VSDDKESMARTDSFSQSTGKVTGRAKPALEQVNKRVRELRMQGEPPEKAVEKAFKEARDNPRKDWRRGGQ